MSPTRKRKGLLQTFEDLEDRIKLLLAAIDSTMNLSFITLYLAKDRVGVDKLTVEHIEACLENAGISRSKESIRNSLSRAGERVKTSKVGPDLFYKLMTKGQLQAEVLVEETGISITQILSGTPRTSKQSVKDLLKSLKGNIYILDPYYGTKSLDILETLGKSARARFITQNTSESGRRLNNTVRDFKREYGNIEIRLAHSSTLIHDRYIIDAKSLYIIGHGIKDIGASDSFMIKLDKSIIKDLYKQLKTQFDNYWTRASVL